MVYALILGHIEIDGRTVGSSDMTSLQRVIFHFVKEAYKLPTISCL
jgi:hypothetical protein